MSSESQAEFLYPVGESLDDEGGEDPGRYCTGGLHPVHLNDIVSASSAEETSKASEGKGYRIIHKLGFGCFSHVWFGQNLSPAHRDAPFESRSQDSGSQNFALCLETFQINGPNGIHDVIVTEPAVLISVIIQNNIIEYLDERIVFKQTLSGLGFLHKHGIIHRDLHLGNIAIEFPFMQSAGVPEIMKGSGHPVCRAIVPMAHTTHSPSIPTYIVDPAKFCGRFWTSLSESTSFVVKVIDFGRSFRPETHDMPDPEQGPPTLKPPECNVRDLIPTGKELPSGPEWSPSMQSANASWPSYVPGNPDLMDVSPSAEHGAMSASPTAVSLDDSSPLADCAGNSEQFYTSTQFPKDQGLEASLSTEEQAREYLEFDWSNRTWKYSESYLPVEVREPAPSPESPDLSDLVWSSQGDIWVLACTLFLIIVRGRFDLFKSLGGGFLFRDIAHYLGPVPDRYRLLLEAGANFRGLNWEDKLRSADCSEALDIDRSLSDPLVIEGNWSQLEDKVYWYRRSYRSPDEEPWTGEVSKSWTAPLELDEEEQKQVTACLQLIRRMLTWTPEDRISASDAVASLNLSLNT